jgi:hypothetical protein
MFKGKFVVLAVLATALLSWQMMPAGVDSANSGIVDPCSSTASSAGGCWVICPQGDGDRLDDFGAEISVNVKDALGNPVPNIPASDFWLIGWNDAITLCGGSGSINADAASDANGDATISGDLAGGGCDVGIQVVVQGIVIADPADWSIPLCLALVVVSPDYNGDLIVDIIDFAIFGPAFPSPPKVLDSCIDFNCDGLVNLIDFAIFGVHYTHSC